MGRRDESPIRVSRAQYDRLRDEANARGVSIQFIASKLIAEGLDSMIPAEEFTLTRKR